MKQFCFAIALAGVLSGCAPTAPSSNGSGAGGNAGAAGNVTQAGAGSGTGGVSVGGVAGSAALAGMGGAAGGGAAGGGAAGGGAAGGGAGGGGGDGPDTSMKPSAGCTKEANQEFGKWVRSTLMSQGLEREYFVYLPQGYDPDPMKPYRLMFSFTGCGSKGDYAPRLFEAPGADAIVVGPTAAEACFAYTAESTDVLFFDEILKVMNANFCVDQNRVFTSGMSSGSWFSNVLGCTRTNVLRAQGNIAGCWPDDGRLDPAICQKHNIAQIAIHDEDDDKNPIACGIVARDRLLTLNGCSTETRPIEPSPCVEYQGCKPGYPVIWCQTQGQGHSRQESLSIPALYNFFAQF